MTTQASGCEVGGVLTAGGGVGRLCAVIGSLLFPAAPPGGRPLRVKLYRGIHNAINHSEKNEKKYSIRPSYKTFKRKFKVSFKFSELNGWSKYFI